MQGLDEEMGAAGKVHACNFLVLRSASEELVNLEARFRARDEQVCSAIRFGVRVR